MPALMLKIHISRALLRARARYAVIFLIMLLYIAFSRAMLMRGAMIRATYALFSLRYCFSMMPLYALLLRYVGFSMTIITPSAPPLR